jgi:Flp pilus assembly protein CpaB
LKKGHIIPKGKVAKYFEEGPIEREEEWIDAVQTMAELEGKKLIEPLSDGRPVPRSAIGQKTQTVAVGVPVTISTLMGGLVRPDDIVDLILVPASLNNSPPLEPILFADVRVIAIKSTSPTNTENENPADQDHVVVVALPVERRYEFATRSAGAKFIMSWSGKSAVPQADEEVAEIKILQGRTKTPTP